MGLLSKKCPAHRPLMHPHLIHSRSGRKQQRRKKTYNTRDSLVVTDPTTSLALTGLSMGERTGSRIFQWVWSYVTVLLGILTD